MRLSCGGAGLNPEVMKRASDERLTPAMACSTTIRLRARRLLKGLFRDFLPLGLRSGVLTVA